MHVDDVVSGAHLEEFSMYKISLDSNCIFHSATMLDVIQKLLWLAANYTAVSCNKATPN